MKTWVRGAAAAAVLVAGTAGAAAQETTWTVGYVNAVGSSYLATIETVADRIEAATDGRLNLELYDTLVPGAQQPAAVRDGRLDASFAVTPWLSAEAPIMNFGHLPGLLTDVGSYQNMLDPLLREVMAEVWLDKYNAVQLATGVFEQQIIISREPIHAVSDFEGKKVRVHNTEAATLMRALGAVPTPVPFGEIVPALQRGIVDVVMTSTGTAYGFGFHTVADHFGVWNIGTVVPWSFIVNADSWEALPDDLKEKVRAEFRAIEDAHFAAHESFSEENMQALVKEGMTMYEPTAAQLDEVFGEENVKQVYDAWYALNEERGTDGRALVDEIRAMKVDQ